MRHDFMELSAMRGPAADDDGSFAASVTLHESTRGLLS